MNVLPHSPRRTLKGFIVAFTLFFLLFFTPGLLKAQVQPTNCPNSNFSAGDFSIWLGCFGIFYLNPVPPPPFPPPPPGSTQLPCQTQGFEPTRHVIIPGPGTIDSYTCGGLTTVYPGEAFSARLGDRNAGGHSEQLKYDVTVDSTNYLFIYRFAVVLESAGHTHQYEQPGFKVEVQNTSGVDIDSTCGYYEFYSSGFAPSPSNPIAPGWNWCPGQGSGSTGVYWKNWTTIGMNLSSYVGQTVRIVFTTRGCCYSAHCGYAYISAYCNRLQMHTAMCEGDTSATITAPPGFSYLWSTITGDPSINGDTTASITVPHPTTGTSYSCLLTAINGCQVTITTVLTYTVIHANFTHGQTCAGLPVQFNDSSYVNQNEVTNWHWTFGDATPMVTGNPNPIHSFTNPGTYQVKLVSFSTEGCKDSITKTVHIDTLPNLSNAPLYKKICSKASSAINCTSDVTGTLFTWTTAGSSASITGYSDNTTTPTTLIDQILINHANTIDTVYYQIAPHMNTCDGIIKTYKVAVKPLPVLTNLPLRKVICDSLNTNLTLTSNFDSTKFTWTCSASSINLTGYSDNTTIPTRILNQVIDNTGYNPDSITYHILPQALGCFGDTVNYVVRVNPTPDLSNTPLTKMICNNTSTNLTLTSHVAGAKFSWTCTASSGSVTGWANSVVDGTVINQILTNSGNNIETVTYHLLPKANSCNGHITNFVVSVNPTPTLSNNPLHKEQCNNLNTNITLTSNVSGTQFTWTCTPSSGNVTGWSNVPVPTLSLSQTLVNSGNINETVTYQLQPVINGCLGVIVPYVVTVYPTPTLTNLPLSKSICRDNSTNVTLTSNVSGTTFTWTCTPSSGFLTGYSDNATPTTFINQVLFNSNNAAETVTYHITPSANSCTGPLTDFVVTVNPKPQVTTNPMSKTICSGDQTNIAITSTCIGTTYVWTPQLVSGNITGFAPGVGALINNTLTNNITTAGVVKYVISATVGTCTANDTNYFVTVNPTPHVTNSPLLKSICSNSGTNISLTADVAGTTFTWTATASSGNVTGYSDNSGSSINQTLVNTGFNIESVTYHITPSANSCDGLIYDYTVTVFPTPDLSFNPSAQTICSGQTTNIQNLSGVTGATFVWTATSSSVNVTGFSADNGSTIAQILTNSGTAIETVTYHVTPSANSCPGTTMDVVITVNPTPHVTTTPLTQTICSATATSISLTSGVTGTTYSWTTTPSSVNLSGFTNGNGNAINQPITNSGFTIESVTYHITPTANSCAGPVTDYVVNINPVPDLSNTPLTKTICKGNPTNITLISNVAATLFTWTCTPSSGFVSGYGDNAVPTTLLDQVLYNTNNIAESVTYHITPLENGCDGQVTDFVVTVNPHPVFTMNPMSKTICSGTSTNLNLTTTCGGTTFTWIASLFSGNITGFTNGSGNLINDNLTNNINTQGEVLYELHALAAGCTGDSNYYVTVNPVPHISTSPLTTTICSGSATNIPLTSDVTGATFSWTATGSSVAVSGFSPGSALTITQILTNSGFNIETVTYHITAHAYGCEGPVTDYPVTVFPTADAYFQPPDQTICTGQTININILSHVSGSTFAYTATPSSGTVSGYSNGAGNNITQILFSTSTIIENVTYHVTPTSNGCTGTSSNVIATINPGPHVTTTPLEQTICSASLVNINLTSDVTGASFSWTAAATSGSLTGYSNGAGNLINQTLINSGYDIDSVIYSIVVSANGCTGGAVNYIVRVNPVPDLSNTPSGEQICNNQATNVTLASHVTGTLFTWTCTPSSGNVTGYSNNSTPTTILNQVLVNSGFAIESVTYHITPHANGCDGPVTNFIVTLVSKPDLTNSPASKQICNNTSTNVTLTSNVSGTLFTWTTTPGSLNVSGYSDNSTPTILLNQTLTNLGYNNETVTYHVTPHANGCDGDITSYVVTVFPTPDLTTAPLSKTLCNNGATNLTLTSNVASTLFSWTCTPSSGSITGFSNSVVPGITINQTLVNTGFNVEAVTYHITPHANGCDGTVYDYLVTLYPTADVYFNPASQTLCSQQTTSIQNLSHVSGTTFTWTATPGSGNLSGFSGGSGNSIAQTITNSGNTIETVTYAVTPTANGCTGTLSNIIVTVNPTPAVTTFPLAQTICSAATTSITLTSAVTGTTFAWTTTASSANLSGFINGSGNTINQALSNSGFTIETVTYHITPTANGCSGLISNYVVTVNPVPDLSNNPLSEQICSATSTNISLTSNVSGTNFSWTATGSSPNITGFAAGSGLIINQVLINSGFLPETVTYHITPSANSCTGILKDFVVTVVSVPDVYFLPVSQTICSNQTTNIQNLSHVPGATFTWTATGSSINLSGFSNGSGNLIVQTLFNSGATIETVTYHVTPQAFGCPVGAPQNVVVTVNPRPTITNPVTSSQLCSGSGTNISLQANVPGTTFTWTATGSSGNVTGFANGSGSLIIQTLTNSGFNIETVTYAVLPAANTCTGTTVNFTVTVYPVADIYFTPVSQTFCSGGTTSLSLASHVAGASFTWTASGSSGNVTGFSTGSGSLIQQTLNNSGYMVETVTYAVLPTANGCPGTINRANVNVNPLPVVSFMSCWDPTSTTDAQSYKLKGALPLGGAYAGAGVNAGSFYPGIAGPGTHTITYSYSNTFGCAGNANQTITLISPVAFTCGNLLTDIRDNQQYPTVQIGAQCWTALNLNYGTTIASAQMQRDNCITEKYCFNDNPANCNSTGGLYQWDEVMQFTSAENAQGFCPPGWHLPKESEWTSLFNFYISNGFAGSPLKSTGYSGFNALLSGVRHENDVWSFSNFANMFWSSTAHSPAKAWAHGMNTYNPSVSYYPSLKSNAFSVRCLKD